MENEAESGKGWSEQDVDTLRDCENMFLFRFKSVFARGFLSIVHAQCSDGVLFDSK